MKKIFLILVLLLFTGCIKKNSYIDTIVVENDNKYITINYPITNTSLDSFIKKEITDIYNKYIKLNKIEVNIDYLLYENDNEISVALFIYINNNNEILKYVKTYYYNNGISNIDDFVDREKLNKILISRIKDYNIPTKYIYGDLEFSFDDSNLIVYFNEQDDYIDIEIPLSLFNKEIIEEEAVISPIVIPEIDIDKSKKVIALTFDDGPSIYTESIINYLHENNCRATFFVLGNKVNDYKDTLKKAIEYGMEIGNHSYNHKWLIKLNKNEIIEQIEKTQELIKQNIGYTPKVLRPTYGSVNDTIRDNTDLSITLWNVDTLDWKYKNINQIVKRATNKLKDGDIILMHDIYKRTASAVKKIVPILKENNFECVTISELNEINYLRNLYE